MEFLVLLDVKDILVLKVRRGKRDQSVLLDLRVLKARQGGPEHPGRQELRGVQDKMETWAQWEMSDLLVKLEL